MKEDDARELYYERRSEVGSGWKMHSPEKEVREHFREVNWTVSLSQNGNLGREFQFPEELVDLIDEYDLRVTVDASDRRVRMTLDNDELTSSNDRS